VTANLSSGAQLLASASFVTADADRGAVLVLATEVTLEQPRSRVASARVLATAHGVYELTLDGAPVTDEVLAPGWTSYEWRLPFQVHDVTDLVRATTGDAPVRLSARVGNGWYRGDLGFDGAMANYGEEIGLLAVLEITFDDGAVQVVRTDENWSGQTCEVTGNNLYRGQRIDGRLRGRPGTPLTVRVGDFDTARLIPQVAEPVRRQDVLRPQSITTSPSGRTLWTSGRTSSAGCG
jgi:alpha-L-rhamnosidase